MSYLTVLSQDPGTRSGAITVVRYEPKPRLLDYWPVSPKKGESVDDRLWRMVETLAKLFQRWDIGVVAYERQSRVMVGGQARAVQNAGNYRVPETVGHLRMMARFCAAGFIVVEPEEAKRALGGVKSTPDTQLVQMARRVVRDVPKVFSGHGAMALGVNLHAARRDIRPILRVPR